MSAMIDGTVFQVRYKICLSLIVIVLRTRLRSVLSCMVTSLGLVPRRTKVAPSIKCIRMRGIAYEKGAGIKGRSHENTSLP